MSSMNSPETPRSSVERDRQVIVTDGGGRDSGAGAVIAVVLALLAVLFVGWLLMNGSDGGIAPAPDNGDTTVNINEAPPAEEPPAEEPPAPPADSTTTTG